MNVIRQAVVYYPTAAYWMTLIDNVTNGSGFDTDRYEYDAGLLRIATKSLTSPTDTMNLIQVALQDDHSGMALKLFDQATAAGVLGTGAAADISRQQRLRALIVTTVAADKARESADMAAAANDANKAATVGYNLVELGQQDQGIALMEKALGGDLDQPNLARLRLGEAYVDLGRNPDAIKMLNTVGGNSGAAAIAGLWLIHLNQKS